MSARRFIVLALALSLVAAFASGCGQKAQPQAGSSTSDSLLSSNPVEQPQGQLQPQSGMQSGGTTQQTAPAPETHGTTPAPKTTHRPSSNPSPPAHEAPSATIPAGTSVKIAIDNALSSETAHAGDSWSGTVQEAVTVGSMAPFPAGSTVHGVVAASQGAEKGSRAYLVLRVTSIESNGKSHEIEATADSMIAGSTRKRNVGAIAGGAAAGALLGKAIGGSNKGALIGGILGGAAATGAVAASKGFQVTVDKGQAVAFHVDRDTKVRL